MDFVSNFASNEADMGESTQQSCHVNATQATRLDANIDNMWKISEEVFVRWLIHPAETQSLCLPPRSLYQILKSPLQPIKLVVGGEDQKSR